MPYVQILHSDDWQREIADALLKILSQKSQAILCITGNSGCGKSTLGKHMRKIGLPGISARDIAVIDDGVLTVPFLGIFRRRFCHKSTNRDNLAPFQSYVRKKKVVVYVKSTPHSRLESCDVVLRLHCPDEVRRERLIRREERGEERFQKTCSYSGEVKVRTNFIFDLNALECPAPIGA